MVPGGYFVTGRLQGTCIYAKHGKGSIVGSMLRKTFEKIICLALSKTTSLSDETDVVAGNQPFKAPYISEHLLGRQFSFSYLNIVDPGHRNVSAVHDLQFEARLISRRLTSHVVPSAGQGCV